ncbi:hypothetical protein A4D02_24965 [Niastella koreensis]|uniref:Uncharacterized protein n=1 Tax=Niastella koreensis TaxID=354356 RepID=A0ABX3P1V3_9BACT|nr:hypothetical protein A4D02_24965 [Niastella koreensis]
MIKAVKRIYFTVKCPGNLLRFRKVDGAHCIVSANTGAAPRRVACGKRPFALSGIVVHGFRLYKMEEM